MAQRKIEKKDNFFAIELREGEEVNVTVKTASGEMQELVFLVPFDCFLNSYMKRQTMPIMWKEH